MTLTEASRLIRDRIKDELTEIDGERVEGVYVTMFPVAQSFATMTFLGDIPNVVFVQPVEVLPFIEMADGTSLLADFRFAISCAKRISGKTHYESEGETAMNLVTRVVEVMEYRKQLSEGPWWHRCGFETLIFGGLSNVSEGTGGNYAAWEALISARATYKQ